MATPKIIPYQVKLRSTTIERSLVRPVVYTNDLRSAEFQFQVTDMQAGELSGATATTLLYMRDGSFFQNPKEDVELTGTTFSYLLKEDEGNHAGIARIQLVVRFNEGLEDEQNFPSQLYDFEIINGLETQVAQQIMIHDWTTLTREARAYIDEFAANEILREAEFDNNEFDRNAAFNLAQTNRQNQFSDLAEDLTATLAAADANIEEFDVALETGIAAAKLAEKLEDFEEINNSRLLSTERQLADTGARINNIATLSEGSTTGDAELIDGRFGADGITYTNIGEALREQVSAQPKTLPSLNLALKYPIKTGKYSTVDGKTIVTTETAWRSIDGRINVENATTLYCALAGGYFCRVYKFNGETFLTSEDVKATSWTIPDGVTDIGISYIDGGAKHSFVLDGGGIIKDPFYDGVVQSFPKTTHGQNLWDYDSKVMGTQNGDYLNITPTGNYHISYPISTEGIKILKTNMSLSFRIWQMTTGGALLSNSGLYLGNPIAIVENADYFRFLIPDSIALSEIQKLYVYEGSDIGRIYYPEAYEEVSDTGISRENALKALKMDDDFSLPAKLYVSSGLATVFNYRPWVRFWNALHDFSLANYAYLAGIPIVNNGTYATITTTSDWNNVESVWSMQDILGQPIKTKQAKVVVSSPTKTTSAIVHAIGDSITDINTQYKYVSDNCTNVSFVGSLKSGTTLLKHDGRSGWTLAQYMETIHSPAEWAGFSPFLHPVTSGYKYYGCTKFWIDAYNNGAYSKSMKATGDAVGGFSPTTGIKLNPILNDVMFNYANSRYEVFDGSAWVVITEAALGGFAFNYGAYLTTWGVTKPSIISIMIGTNDYSRVGWYDAKNTTNAKFKTWYDTIIASIKLVDPTISVILNIAPMFSINNHTSSDNTRLKNLAMFENRKNLIENFDGREAEKIYVNDIGSSVDPEKDFTTDVNGIVTDVTHPASSGFTKMGVRLKAIIDYIR